MSQSNGYGPLTVLGLQAESIKRLKAVQIVPPATGVVKISGKNDQGKSSAIDSIFMALGGKTAQPEVPIRKGAKSAKVVLDLGALRVTRSWTEKDTYLTVERKDGGKLSKPQDLLDELVGAGLGFDPLNFLHLKPADQVKTLLGLLNLPDDPRRLDEQKKALYDERTLVNRDLRQHEGALATLPDPGAGVPLAEISVSELATEYSRLSATIRQNDEKRATLERIERDWLQAGQEVAQLSRQLEAAKARLAAIEASRDEANAIVATLRDPDLEAITRQMQDAEQTNAKVKLQRDHVQALSLVEAAKATSDELTAKIEAIEQHKRDLLASATFPIEGLGFEEIGGDYQVTFNGFPLSQIAHSQQIDISLAIAMALNPKIRVILLREGSLLDDETMARIAQRVSDRGFQCWTEIVGEGDAASFVIEDGGVIRAPKQEELEVSW